MAWITTARTSAIRRTTRSWLIGTPLGDVTWTRCPSQVSGSGTASSAGPRTGRRRPKPRPLGVLVGDRRPQPTAPPDALGELVGHRDEPPPATRRTDRVVMLDRPVLPGRRVEAAAERGRDRADHLGQTSPSRCARHTRATWTGGDMRLGPASGCTASAATVPARRAARRVWRGSWSQVTTSPSKLSRRVLHAGSRANSSSPKRRVRAPGRRTISLTAPFPARIARGGRLRARLMGPTIHRCGRDRA